MSKHYTFTKMHGCGNDYIYFDCFGQELYDPETMSLILSDRHVGIGGDGIILLCPSDKADFKMRMFNADGSEGKMCGNGIRCAAKLARDHGIAKSDEITVETLAGMKYVTILEDTRTMNGKVVMCRVDMDKPTFDNESLSAVLPVEKAIHYETMFGGARRIINAVGVGSVHCVLFGEENRLTDPDGEKFDIDHFDIEKIGPACEHDPLFTNRCNVEFATVLDRRTIAMRVWERGSGETRACGTGACATVVAACENGLCDRDTDVTVRLLGGELTIRWASEENGGRIYMTGPAATVFEGDLLF